MFECTNDLIPYKCDECPEFQTLLLLHLKTHITQGHKPQNHDEIYKCPFCNFESFSKLLLLRHKVTKHRNIEWSECAKCPKKFKRKSSLRKHMMVIHTENIQWFECDKCPKKFKCKGYLQSHSKIHTDIIQWWNCGQCKSKFKWKSSLKSHYAIKHPGCKNANFKNLSQLERDLACAKVKVFECKECYKTFGRASHLRNHTITQHTSLEDIKWFECERCGAKFKLKATLTNHIISQHSEVENMTCGKCQQYICPKYSKWFHCEVCPKKFKYKSALQDHVLEQHPEMENRNWFECKKCGQQLKSKENLKQDIKSRLGKFLNLMVKEAG